MSCEFKSKQTCRARANLLNMPRESTGCDECDVIVTVREVGDLSAAVGTKGPTNKLRAGKNCVL